MGSPNACCKTHAGRCKKHRVPIPLMWQFIEELCCSHLAYMLVFYLCGNREVQRWDGILGHHQSFRLCCKHIVVRVPGPDNMDVLLDAVLQM